MASQLRSWWQQIKRRPFIITIYSWWRQIKRHPFIIALVIFVVIFALAFIFAVQVFGWGWTGLAGGVSKTTTTISNKGTTIATELQPGRTLWDVLQLLGILAIPVVVGLGTVWFTTAQSKASAAENKDNQREDALQTYIDNISVHLLKNELGIPNKELGTPNLADVPNVQAQKIARVRTMTVLRSLDGARKASLLLFLYESDLIRTDIHDGIIDLRGADFSQADLATANLSHDTLEGTTKVSKDWLKMHSLYGNLYRAKLRGTTLKAAKLPGANLNEADLSDAYLSRADLKEADLVNANLHGARLRKAILESANLIGTDLRETNLHYADLKSAKLCRAQLCKAELKEANLIRADLSEADLTGADLEGANLTGADLTRAIITREQLNTVKSLKGAIMPDGSKHPYSGSQKP